MKKLLRASCLALAVWLVTVPALADIIVEPRPRPTPQEELELYVNQSSANQPSVLVAVLVLGVVAIAAALLVRTVLRMRKP